MANKPISSYLRMIIGKSQRVFALPQGSHRRRCRALALGGKVVEFSPTAFNPSFLQIAHRLRRLPTTRRIVYEKPNRITEGRRS
jgi:hypothetical protein